jgi:uncharacterized protein YndB with AHSA1/START domain
MKILKKIVIGVVALLALLVLIGFMLPAKTHVARSVVINAPAETVFTLINNFHEFNRWSPWAQRDPETRYQFEGPESGVGAKMSWASDKPEVGSGSQTIIEAEANTTVVTALDFGEHGVATARYSLAPLGDSVSVIAG